MPQKLPTVAVDGLGVLLLGLAALLCIPLVMALSWAATSVRADCGPECVALADLDAQAAMASAAWGMLAVSLFGSIVGVVTLIFLALTLRETRQATAVAREIGEKQARAYLNIDKATMKATDFFGMIDVTVVVRNTGQSPARNLRLESTLRAFNIDFDPDGNDFETDIFRQDRRCPIHAVSGGDTVTARLNFYSESEWSLVKVLEDNGHPIIETSFTLRYDTVFGVEDAETAKFTGSIHGDKPLSVGVEMSKGSH